MPSIRIGFSSEFVLRNELVGIGSTATSSRLDVAGQIRSENTAGSGGVSTFREYQGFSQTQAEISNNILIDNGYCGPFGSLTGEIKITGETTVSSGSTVEVGKTKTLTVTDRFAVPLGDTNSRDNTPEAGTTRFNQDFGTLEFFDGNNWKTVNSYSRGGAAGRAVIAQGYTSSAISTMEYVNLISRGNGQDFGDAQVAYNAAIGGCSDGARGVWAGLQASPASTIQYTTITSGGGSIDFGSLNEAIWRSAGHSSSTRGLWMSGRKSPGNPIVSCQTIQIQTLGNSLDFGDAAAARRMHDSGMGSPTRAFMLGGYDGDYKNEIQFKSIASGGDMVFGGDLVYTGGYIAGCSNSIRGFATGGYLYPGSPGYFASNINSIDLSSAGNAINFGDLIQKSSYACSAATQTRAFRFGGVQFNPSGTVLISRIEEWSTTSSGNATEFGDLTEAKYDMAQMSDSHGGLGGF